VQLQSGGKSLGTYTLDKNGLIYVPCGPGTNCDLGLGSYNFVAIYSGDASFKAANGASAAKIPFTISKGVLYWETFVNTQTPPAGGVVIATTYFSNDPLAVPAGTVTLTRSDTSAVLGSGTIDKAGVSTISFHAPAGTYFVDASYAGDKDYISAGQSISQEIITSNVGSTRAYLALELNAKNVSLGQHTQYSVSVVPATGSTATPIGTVTLYSASGHVAGSLYLSGGRATGFIEWDQVGPQQIYATYSGDSLYTAANGPMVNVTVAQAVPAVTVQTSSSTIQAGAQVSITALLSSSISSTNVAAPTGTIQFFDAVNGKAPVAIGTPQIITGGNGGTLLASLAPVLEAGSHAITGVYSGDANWKTATGAASAPIVATK